MDMGTTAGGQDMYEDLVQMTDRGRHQVADNPLIPGTKSAVNYLDGLGYDTTSLLAGGMEMGPCYLYGLAPLKDFRYADIPNGPYSPFMEIFTAIGEFCTGASINLGLAKTLLDGTPSGKPAVSACGARKCGDDGCGGTCGTCGAGESCSAEGQCTGSTTCTPSCAGKTCGSDGCGGSCGDCGTSSGSSGSSGASGGAAADPGASDGAASDGGGCSTTPGRDRRTGLGAALALALGALAIRRARRSDPPELLTAEDDGPARADGR